MKQLRQGDVLLMECPAPIDEAACASASKAVDDVKNNAFADARKAAYGHDVVLAEGEATGHAHRVRSVGAVVLWLIAARRYLQVMESATLDHEEHGKIDLDPGWYEVRRQREFDAGRVRWVAD